MIDRMNDRSDHDLNLCSAMPFHKLYILKQNILVCTTFRALKNRRPSNNDLKRHNILLPLCDCTVLIN